jgi:hypothetical protein
LWVKDLWAFLVSLTVLTIGVSFSLIFLHSVIISYRVLAFFIILHYNGRMKKMIMPLVATSVLIGGVTPVYAEDRFIPEFVVSSTLPAPKFERLSVISIIDAPIYSPNSKLSPEELKNLLYRVGFRGESLRQAWGIAMKESTGRPMAHNQNSRTGDNSYGLFQINMIGNLGPARLKEFNLDSNEDLFDPLTNAKIAYIMSDGGKNWSPWSGLTGSTLKWMRDFPK